MQKLVLSFLLLSSQAFAVNFLNNSKVPSELQKEITAAVASKFPCLSALSEERSEVVGLPLDQFYDLYFTTWMNGSYLFDGTHPVGVALSVKSAKYDFANGKNVEVFSVDAEGGAFSCPQ